MCNVGEECSCQCHWNNGIVVKHFMPCCMQCHVCGKHIPFPASQAHLEKHEEESGEITISVRQLIDNPEAVADRVVKVANAVRKGSATGVELISIKIAR